MKTKFFWVLVLLASGFGLSVQAGPAPTGAQICKKMISEGRGGVLDQKKCLCMYQQADQILDADLKALLFKSWFDGSDNMAAVERLPGQARVVSQMATLVRAARGTCKVE